MKILISGASGFIGRALTNYFGKQHEVIPLLRDFSNLIESDAIIHLSGEPIGEGFWTKNKRKRILNSRVEGTNKLFSKIKLLNSKKRTVVVSASAIGFYGNRGDEVLTEQSASGSGFLSYVCQMWEKETLAELPKNYRQVVLRLGLILGCGGALQKIAPIFRFGLGGPLGGGQQWMSWIHINDLVRMIEFVIQNNSVSGIVNAVSPQPTTNKEFSEILAGTLNTKSWLPVPKSVLKIILGEKSELVLSSQRVLPNRMIELGFSYKFSKIGEALKEILNKKEVGE